jgi:hypothetical protein
MEILGWERKMKRERRQLTTIIINTFLTYYRMDRRARWRAWAGRGR